MPGPLLCLISLDSFLTFRFFIKWRIVYTVKMQVVDQRRATDCEMHASWGRCSLASYDVCMPMSTPAHHAWVCAKTLQLCLTLCNPMDCSLPASSVHGILQARKLEWVTIPSSRGSSPTRDQTCVSYISCVGKQVSYH